MDLAPRTAPLADLALPADLAADAAALAEGSRSASTRRTYDREWRGFVAWCASHGRSPLPATPETVGGFVADQSKRRAPAGVDLALAAVAFAHKVHGLEAPTRHAAVRAVREGARRARGTAQRQVEPITVDVLERLIAELDPGSLAGARDRALLLLGFAAALRRSELVALEVEDLRPAHGGLEVRVRRSKTDQAGAGRTIAVPRARRAGLCPVAALEAWLSASGIAEGPVFRSIDRHGNIAGAALSDRAVALVVKRVAEHAGLDSSSLSGHSLRAGLATSAALAGVEERVIAQTTGHRSSAVLRRYIRGAEIWRQNAAGAVL